MNFVYDLCSGVKSLFVTDPETVKAYKVLVEEKRRLSLKIDSYRQLSIEDPSLDERIKYSQKCKTLEAQLQNTKMWIGKLRIIHPFVTEAIDNELKTTENIKTH